MQTNAVAQHHRKTKPGIKSYCSGKGKTNLQVVLTQNHALSSAKKVPALPYKGEEDFRSRATSRRLENYNFSTKMFRISRAMMIL